MDVCICRWLRITLPDLSTYLNLKGISWLQRVQPRLRMWHVTFLFFSFLRTWLLYVLEPKPLASPNSWNWRPNKEHLTGSCQPVSCFWKPFTCCASAACFCCLETLLTSLAVTSLLARGVTWGSWPMVCLEFCWEPLLSSCQIICKMDVSLQGCRPSRSCVPLIVWGEGYTQQVLLLAAAPPPQFTTHRPNPCHKAGWLGKEPTSLRGNTDLFAAPSLQAECTAVSWGESQSVLGLAGCVWGNRNTCVIWIQGLHRPGSCRGGDGLHPTPLWVCAPEGECWQKKDSRRVLPMWCVSNSNINLSFSIKMSFWKMSYGLCCWGWQVCCHTAVFQGLQK